MSKQNKANKNNYSQAGRLTPDDMARERQKMPKVAALRAERVKAQETTPRMAKAQETAPRVPKAQETARKVPEVQETASRVPKAPRAARGATRPRTGRGE